MVISEGSTVMAVEELEHARQRGARIYAELVGFGAAFDRKRDGSGIARAIRAALKEAGIGPEDIDHINAHGLSTPEGDVWESRGLQEVFGNCPRPLLAAKGHLGNMGAAGGLTELAAGVLALQNAVVPATLNYEEPDPQCPVPVVTGTPRTVERPYLLKVGFTDMGQVAAVVCRQWK
jgi:3-oxoacyl-[acyl-carrier-protein] synthase II